MFDTTWNKRGEQDLINGLAINSKDFDNDGIKSGVGDILSSADWMRVDDSMDGTWYDLNGGISIEAIYTSADLTFGFATLAGGQASFTTNLPGKSFTNDNGDAGVFDEVNDAGTFDHMPNSDKLVFGVTSGSKTLYSNAAWNGGKDRMVTFQSKSDPTKFAFAFEDGNDDDYQDFVVVLNHLTNIPSPSAVLLGLVGLSALGGIARRIA